MSIEIVKEVWDALKLVINQSDIEEAAETLINVLVDNDFDSAEIKEAFRRDQSVMDALKYFNEHEEEAEYEDYEEEYDEDEEY